MPPKVIMSCTTYPARFHAVAQCLEPLFRQTVQPDEICLWLGRDDCGSLADLPFELLELRALGLSIRWCDHTLMPHDKYFWTMREHPDDIVITVDDDVIYPLDLVERLLSAHYRHPHAIVANNTHLIGLDGNGALLSYARWIPSQTRYINEPRFDIMAVGVGGVLYPPRCFAVNNVFDESSIRRYAIKNDDLWLFAHAAMGGVPVVAVNANPGIVYLPDTQDVGLYHANLEGSGNDDCIKGLFGLYPEFEKALMGRLSYEEAQEPASECPPACQELSSLSFGERIRSIIRRR